MSNIEQGMTFYIGVREVEHVHGTVPVPRVGEIVKFNKDIFGRVRWVEYNYTHLSSGTLVGIHVELGDL